MISHLLGRLFRREHAEADEPLPGMYIGAYRDPKNGRLEWLYDTTDRHVLLAAPTRGGKDVSFAIPNLLNYPESVVVFDLKGELWELTSGYRRDVLGNTVLRVEPMCEDGTSARFDVQDEVRIGTPFEFGDTSNHSTWMVDPDGKAMTGEHAHWIRTSRNFLDAAKLHVRYACADTSLHGVSRFLSNPQSGQEDVFADMLYGQHDPHFMRGWLDENNEPTATMPEIAMAARDMIERPPGECGSILSAAKSHLDLYRDPIVASNTSTSDFSIADLMHNEKPVTLYVVVKPSDMDRLRPFVRLLFNCILETLTPKFTRDDDGRAKPKYKHPLLLLFNEFPLLGNLASFTSSLPWLAGYGIRVALIIQDYSQLVAQYGQAAADSIMANMHIKILYPTNDPNTAKKFSDMLGRTTIRYNTQSVDARGKSSWSERLDGRPLLTSDEFMTLQKPAGVITLNQGRPIQSEQILYFDEPMFTSRLLPACERSDRIAPEQQAGRKALALLQRKALEEAKERLIHAIPLSAEARVGRDQRRAALRARIAAEKAARREKPDRQRNNPLG